MPLKARKTRTGTRTRRWQGKNPAKAAPSASGELSLPVESEPAATTVPDPVLAPADATKAERPAKAPKAVTAATPEPAAGTRCCGQTGQAGVGRSAGRPGQGALSRRAGLIGLDPFNYFVQAGAYRTPEDAEQQRARLLLLGMQAKVTEREQAGRTVYRVRVGPFDKKDDADKVKDRLDNNSIETALVRVQR